HFTLRWGRFQVQVHVPAALAPVGALFGVRRASPPLIFFLCFFDSKKSQTSKKAMLAALQKHPKKTKPRRSPHPKTSQNIQSGDARRTPKNKNIKTSKAAMLAALQKKPHKKGRDSFGGTALGVLRPPKSFPLFRQLFPILFVGPSCCRPV